MASFTINFNANASGDHYVGWRTYDDTPAFFHNIIVVPVSVPGPQSVIIEVPGSLYCAYDGILYTGYVVAECQLNDSATLLATGIPNPALPPTGDDSQPTDGIPDTAMTWNVAMATQVDPCIKVNVECTGVGLEEIGKDTKGSLYTSDPTVTVTGGGAAVQATATAARGNGIIDSFGGATTFGSGYGIGNASSTQLVDIIRTAQVATDGVGGRATVIFDAAAVITSITLLGGGLEYTSTDYAAGYTLKNALLTDTAAPAVEAVIIVNTIGDWHDEIETFTVVTPGSLYTSVPTVTTTGGGGTGGGGTGVLADCSTLDIGLYDCAGQNDITGTPDYNLNLGESVNFCADTSTLAALPSEFTDTLAGNCHCEECKHVTVGTGGSGSGVGKVTYQTCWDGSNALGSIITVTQQVISGQQVDLGCIIESTLTSDDGSLFGGVITVNSSVTCI